MKREGLEREALIFGEEPSPFLNLRLAKIGTRHTDLHHKKNRNKSTTPLPCKGDSAQFSRLQQAILAIEEIGLLIVTDNQVQEQDLNEGRRISITQSWSWWRFRKKLICGPSWTKNEDWGMDPPGFSGLSASKYPLSPFTALLDLLSPIKGFSRPYCHHHLSHYFFLLVSLLFSNKPKMEPDDKIYKDAPVNLDESARSGNNVKRKNIASSLIPSTAEEADGIIDALKFHESAEEVTGDRTNGLRFGNCRQRQNKGEIEEKLSKKLLANETMENTAKWKTRPRQLGKNQCWITAVTLEQEVSKDCSSENDVFLLKICNWISWHVIGFEKVFTYLWVCQSRWYVDGEDHLMIFSGRWFLLLSTLIFADLMISIHGQAWDKTNESKDVGWWQSAIH